MLPFLDWVWCEPHSFGRPTWLRYRSSYLHHVLELCGWYYSPAQQQIPLCWWHPSLHGLQPNRSIPNSAECALSRLSNCKTDWSLTNFYWTKFFIAASSHHQKGLSQLTLTVNNKTIKPSQTMQDSGLFFDSSKAMSTNVTSTVHASPSTIHIRNISKIRKYIDSNTSHAKLQFVDVIAMVWKSAFARRVMARIVYIFCTN